MSFPRRTRSILIAGNSLLCLAGLCGCAVQPVPAPTLPAEPVHPLVKIEGNDGTILNGELLNGSMTIQCGQGELTLLTDHIYSMTFDKEGDTLMSASVKVFGHVEDTELRLKTEHGVFKLLKENLHSVQFASAKTTNPSEPIYNPAATTHTSNP